MALLRDLGEPLQILLRRAVEIADPQFRRDAERRRMGNAAIGRDGRQARQLAHQPWRRGHVPAEKQHVAIHRNILRITGTAVRIGGRL